MSNDPKFEINLDELFNGGKPLSNPPVIEAVIHWRARSESNLDPQKFLESLRQRLTGYPSSQPQAEVEMKFEAGPDGSKQSHQTNWHGFRFESEDKLHVAQFTRNGFVFSRLKSYEQWKQFTNEAIKLWKVYVELANPVEVERLGVRFINVIEPVMPDNLGEWLKNVPKGPVEMGLPLAGFMHHDTFLVPERPYRLNVIQTIQPPIGQAEGQRLILDLDVFTVGVPFAPDDKKLTTCLEELRWLKNKAFSTYLTEEAIESFR